MTEQEPTELMILLKIVQVLERRMLRDNRSGIERDAGSTVASVVNNFIASNPSIMFETSNERIVMGDNYTTGQAGAVGPMSSAQNMSFNQIWNQAGPAIDLPSLARELEDMRKEMKLRTLGEPEHDISVAEVAQAEIAARSADGPKALEHLRNAGEWVLEIAKSIGSEVTIAAFKAATGM